MIIPAGDTVTLRACLKIADANSQITDNTDTDILDTCKDIHNAWGSSRWWQCWPPALKPG